MEAKRGGTLRRSLLTYGHTKSAVCSVALRLGVAVLTYAPSSAAWWTSYATAQRLLWRTVGPAHPTARH